MVNKKGQESGGPSSLGYIIGFILLAGVAIFAFYWFYSSGKTIFDKKDILINDLSFAAQACDTAAQNPDLAVAKNNYCVAPKKINVAGKDGYFNCPYIKLGLGASIPNADSITCDNGYDNADIWRYYYCAQLKNAGTDTTKVWVNGDKCAELTKAKLETICGSANLPLSETNCASGSSRQWTVQSSDDKKNYNCCVKIKKL